MPVYRRNERHKWLVVIYWEGGRHDWIVRGTKADAEAFEARKRRELEANALPEHRVVPTLSDFLRSQYKPHAQTRLKTSTWRNRVYQLATLDEFFGSMRLNAIGAPEIAQYQDLRMRAKMRPSTINDEIKVLRTILSFARLQRLPVQTIPAAKLPVRTRRHAEAWTSEEVTSLYQSAAEKHPQLLPVLECLANTGLRKGEALALEWKNVDLERMVFRIWPSEEWQPKDNEPRLVPINDVLAVQLKMPRKSHRWVFPTGRGGRYAYWPQRMFDEVRDAAGLTGGPHKLRHTYASHFLASTPDLPQLAQILGHSHARVTQLYAHLLPDQFERGRRAVSLPAPAPSAAAAAAMKWGLKR